MPTIQFVILALVFACGFFFMLHGSTGWPIQKNISFGVIFGCFMAMLADISTQLTQLSKLLH